MGWEHDRIIYGIKERPPNKLIIISSDPKKAPNKKWGQITTQLSEKICESIKPLIDCEIILLDYHSLEECLEKTVELIEKESKKFDEINVNISSGTTLAKMALMLCAQYYPIKLFYVIPGNYTHPGEIISTGAKGLVELPSINLSKITMPRKKEEEMLFLLNKEWKTFTQIIKEYAKTKGIKLNKERIAELKAGIFYHIKKFESRGLIQTKIEKRELQICLTTTGTFIKTVLAHQNKENEKQTKLKIKQTKRIETE